ncbi:MULTISPECIES: hypothetical protein [Cohaesibacter]|uniref:hypothetical protein n=1 Tax=Cohaesibacter TaxID=655352 RepID=UPI000DEBE0D5|nr:MULTISPECIES: hypothetical protein [Cohaesibacter]TLP46947.1 hypothetical protein FDK21_08000 [Cohaesibacter sp. CAU 1516]
MTKKTKQSRESQDEARRMEAERTLKRVDMDSEAIGTSTLARAAGRAKGHLGGSDVDPNDPIELWGTRIGRSAGAIFAIILVLWLISHFTR